MLSPTDSPRPICPLPLAWHRIYKELSVHWERTGEVGAPPPRPIILSGWWASDAHEKAVRWQELVLWAGERGLAEIPMNVSDDEWASEFDAGGSEWPRYLLVRQAPASRIEQHERTAALERLRKVWPDIAGSFASYSIPAALTGRKGRRLVVVSDVSGIAPWGTWSYIAKKEPFTRFRARVNAVLQPHSVDHIDFMSRYRGLHPPGSN
jgi:hypothetical protein